METVKRYSVIKIHKKLSVNGRMDQYHHTISQQTSSEAQALNFHILQVFRYIVIGDTADMTKEINSLQ